MESPTRPKTTRRGRWARFLAGVALLVLAGCCMDTAAPEKTLVASGHPDWPPVMFVQDGKIDGVGPALAKQIFGDLHIPVVVPYEGPWDQVQAKARTGEVDVLVAAYKTTAREEYMVYSEAYITDPLVLFVKKGKEFAFAQDEDLIGKAGVGTVGDSYGQDFDNYIAAHLKFARAPTAKEAFDMVENGQADYFIYSLYSGREELKTGHREAPFAVLPHHVAEEPFYLTISKKSPYVKYLPEINRLIDKYKADGSVAAWLAQYKKQFSLSD